MPSVAIPFIESGSYPMRPGNSVRPLIDGEPAFRRICEAIEAQPTLDYMPVASLKRLQARLDALTTSPATAAARPHSAVYIGVRVSSWANDTAPSTFSSESLWAWSLISAGDDPPALV